MNLANQIDAIARAATDDVVAASHVYAQSQRHLVDELAAHRTQQATDDQRLRTQLTHEANEANTTPRVLLPADVAQASPHTPPVTE